MTQPWGFKIQIFFFFCDWGGKGGMLKGSSSVSHEVQFAERNEIIMVFSIDGVRRRENCVGGTARPQNLSFVCLFCVSLKKSYSVATAPVKLNFSK